jgi:polyhydroxybutyrate depolymerase
MIKWAPGIVTGMMMSLVASQAFAARMINMDYRGQRRTLLLERPAGSNPRPTVIMLHGANGNAIAMSRVTGMGKLGLREGFVTVFVNGLGNLWNDGRPEHTRVIREHGLPIADDLGFLRALVVELVKRGIADPRRIYLAGFSNGGEMTLRMACDAAELFAAVGTISALMPESTGARCHPAVPMPAVLMSGTADRTMPFNGGPLGNGQGTVWSAQKTAAFFRQLDGCTGIGKKIMLPKHNQRDPTDVTEFRWTNCKAGAVILYQIERGGHGIPGAKVPGRIGMETRGPGNTTELNASQVLWAFFRDKKR